MSNESAIVWKGASGMKTVSGIGGPQNVVPVIGQDPYGRLGIGFVIEPTENRKSILVKIPSLNLPSFLIRAWRATKLLEQMPEMNDFVLADCWTLAHETVELSDDRCFARQVPAFEGEHALRSARAQAIAQFPTEDELADMLAKCATHKVEIDLNEIEEARATLRSVEEIFERLQRTDEERFERLLVAALEARRASPAEERQRPRGTSLFARLFR